MKKTLIDRLKGNALGIILLICSTSLEAFYSYKLFLHTGELTFLNLTPKVAVFYSVLIGFVIVWFTLRGNMFVVNVAIYFELCMNTLLDIMMIAIPRPENWFWIFLSQLIIGGLLPLSTKAFAIELNKQKEVLSTEESDKIDKGRLIPIKEKQKKQSNGNRASSLN